MSYIKDQLNEGETIIAEGKIGKFVYFSVWCWVFVGVVMLLADGVGVIFLVIALWQYLSAKATKIGITSQRLIAKKGVIFTDAIDINLKQLESISIKQGLLGRMFGYGTLIVTGSGTSCVKLHYIEAPQALRKKAMFAIENR